MKYAHTHVLLPADAAGVNANGVPYWPYWPPNQMDFPLAEYVTWHFAIFGVTGAPATWSVQAKFQWQIEHTTGLFLANPIWHDFQDEQVKASVVEGVGFYGAAHSAPVGAALGLIADQTDNAALATAPIVVSRTVRMGGNVRVRVRTVHTFPGADVTSRVQMGVTLSEKG